MSISFAVFGCLSSDPGQIGAVRNLSAAGGVILSGDNPPTSVAITAGSLPPGMILALLSLALIPKTVFVLAGTPTSAGTFAFDLTFTDSTAQVLVVSVSLIIGLTQSVEMDLPNGNQAEAYSFTFNDAYALSAFAFVAKIGVPPFTYGPLLWSGFNPGGLTLSGSGVLAGTPVAPFLSAPDQGETFEASIEITDSTAQAVGEDMSLFIFGGAPWPPPGTPTGEVHGTFTGFFAAGQIGGGTK